MLSEEIVTAAENILSKLDKKIVLLNKGISPLENCRIIRVDFEQASREIKDPEPNNEQLSFVASQLITLIDVAEKHWLEEERP